MVHRANKHGLAPDRLRFLKAVIEDDIKRGLYYGAVILVARNGVVGLHEAIGYTDSKNRRPVTKKSVFSLFSTTKAITNVLVYRAIERGEFALTTKVSEIIPEFSGGLRQQITFYHLLTHSSGLPSVFTPAPGMYIDKLDEIVAAICANVHSIEEPGKIVTYAPMAAHALMGEAVRRTDPKKRSYRRLVEDEILRPLKMKDTSVGVRKDLRTRHIVPIFLDQSPIDHLGHSNFGPNGAFEEENAEMPWVGCISTVSDMFRFAEMLRRGGELDGARIVSPTILDMATRNQTGEKPNDLFTPVALERGWEPSPAYLGIGFFLRGEAVCHHHFGTLTSPRTFGNLGLGSTIFWVDPERDMTFVCLSAGVMNEGDNIERFQRLSDIAVSAAI
ncbi:MAG TPA: serine hydrolase domain-containing protein [Candidatus Acidoferrales bacterium]|nr:serine hydrolase domain-containing protein [Candidatus Acidoferrales bacterium]